MGRQDPWRGGGGRRRERVPVEQCHAAVAAHGLPLPAAKELDERPQWPRLLQGLVPPLLPVQPRRRRLGQQDRVGPRRVPRPRPLAPPPAGHGPRPLVRHQRRLDGLRHHAPRRPPRHALHRLHQRLRPGAVPGRPRRRRRPAAHQLDQRADVSKGWASLQGVPRTVLLDTKTGANLLQWPVEEVETLRANSTDLSGITVDHGSVFPLDLRRATQLDIEAEFQLDRRAIAAALDDDVGYSCSTSGGAAARGALGPFGLLVLADRRRRGEQTAVYFYVDGSLATHFCQDESRSSRANDVVGSAVPVLEDEATLSLRVLVDHSIVESFAQGGRSTATSRV
ncbi:Acid beta-fructofuranosidase 3 vacuolar, partial [Zea mays]